MGKKTKKAKLPKEVMGIRLPKEVREAGGALLEKANSPQGREMLAAGLTMASAAATAALAKRRAGRATPPEPPRAPDAPVPPVPPVPPQGTQTQPNPAAIVDAVGKAAEAMLGKLFGGKKG